MPSSPIGRPRTLGVDAERLNDAECFLRRRCESTAAVVRGIMVGGGMEVRISWSNEVEKGSSGCCTSGSCTAASSRSDAMTNSFIFLPPWVARLEVGRCERNLSFTLVEFPAAI